MEELVEIITKFSESGWDVIDIPSKKRLLALNESGVENNASKDLINAVEQANKDCGNCGCEFDPLYRRALELLRSAA